MNVPVATASFTVKTVPKTKHHTKEFIRFHPEACVVSKSKPGKYVSFTVKTRFPCCLYCTAQADISVFVEDETMWIQLTCEDHIPEGALILWRRDEN